MEQVMEPKFSCAGCGKTFRWKPEIAGKKAKCGCGTSIMVPANAPGVAKPKLVVTTTVAAKKVAIPITAVRKKPALQPVLRKPIAARAAPTAPVPIPEPQVSEPAPAAAAEEDDQGEYDFADGDISQLGSLLPTPEAIAAAERETPPALPAQPMAAEPLEYRRPAQKPKVRADRVDPMTGELPDPMRNYIVPGALLAAGLTGIVLHVTARVGIGAAATVAIPVVMAIMLTFTAVKTLILVLLAFPLAAYSDVYMGLLRTAIFKLAATIFFGDVAILWLITALRSAGVIQGRGEGGISFWLIYAVVLALIFYVCFLYLFQISVSDLRFAYRMSLASRICNIGLNLALIAFIGSLTASHIRASNANVLSVQSVPAQSATANIPISQTPIAIAPGTPVIAQPGQSAPTVMDTLVSQEIQRGKMMEGYAWCRTGVADDAAKKLIDDMYHAGADKVYVHGFTVYTLLPGDPAKRSGCLAVAHAFRKQYAMPDGPGAGALNYQYAVISLADEQMMRAQH